jgi:hypothetical protein
LCRRLATYAPGDAVAHRIDDESEGAADVEPRRPKSRAFDLVLVLLGVAPRVLGCLLDPRARVGDGLVEGRTAAAQKAGSLAADILGAAVGFG